MSRGKQHYKTDWKRLGSFFGCVSVLSGAIVSYLPSENLYMQDRSGKMKGWRMIICGKAEGSICWVFGFGIK